MSPGASSASQVTRLVEFGERSDGLDHRGADNGELAVRAVQIERVHPAAPVVAVPEQVRRGMHFDPMFDRELARRVERRDARLVVRRVHDVRVR